MKTVETKKVYLDDLLTGLFALMSRHKVRGLDFRSNRIDRVFEESMSEIKRLAREYGLEWSSPDVRTHELHGDSEQIERGLRECIYRGIARSTIPSDGIIYTKIAEEESEAFLKNLPGERAFYERITRYIINRIRDTR